MSKDKIVGEVVKRVTFILIRDKEGNHCDKCVFRSDNSCENSIYLLCRPDEYWILDDSEDKEEGE